MYDLDFDPWPLESLAVEANRWTSIPPRLGSGKDWAALVQRAASKAGPAPGWAGKNSEVCCVFKILARAIVMVFPEKEPLSWCQCPITGSMTIGTLIMVVKIPKRLTTIPTNPKWLGLQIGMKPQLVLLMSL